MKIAIINSGLPKKIKDSRSIGSQLINSLGPSNKGFRGQNSGNGLITMYFLQSLDPSIEPIVDIPNIWQVDDIEAIAGAINESCQIAVFVCQDFLRPDSSILPFSKLNKFLTLLSVQIVPVSLGMNSFEGYSSSLVKSLSSEQCLFAKLLSEKSNAIGIRGEYTADLLSHLGITNINIIGCPSYYGPGESKMINKNRFTNQIVTTGDYQNIMFPSTCHWIQDELDIASLAYQSFGDPETYVNLHSPIWMLSLLFQDKIRFVGGYENWLSNEEFSSACLVIGTRVHGAILGTNLGIPAVVINRDMRAKEMCMALSIPCLPNTSPYDDIEAVYDSLDIHNQMSTYLDLLDNYKQFLASSGLLYGQRNLQDINFASIAPESRSLHDMQARIHKVILDGYLKENKTLKSKLIALIKQVPGKVSSKVSSSVRRSLRTFL